MRGSYLSRKGRSFLNLFPSSMSSADAGGLDFTIEPQDVVVEQGGSARLDCAATSVFGTPSIHWRTDDGQPITFIGDSYR